MKKTNPYAVGVIAFLALMLFFAVAMFIGPEPKLRNSQTIKNYAGELEDLAISAEADNRRIEDELATTACREMAERSAYLFWEAGNLQTQVFANFGVVLDREGLLDKDAVNLPDPIEQNLAEIRRLIRKRSDLVRQRLSECLNEVDG